MLVPCQQGLKSCELLGRRMNTDGTRVKHAREKSRDEICLSRGLARLASVKLRRLLAAVADDRQQQRLSGPEQAVSKGPLAAVDEPLYRQQSN